MNNLLNILKKNINSIKKVFLVNLTLLFKFFMSSKKIKLSLTIENIYNPNYGLNKEQNHLRLEIAGYIDNVCASMPRIKYIFK